MTFPADPLPFVGRTREVAVMLTRLDAACAGSGSTALIGGEPGIGKTRLMEEIAATAAARGVTVLWGRCHEAGSAPAFWPWRQIIRNHVAHSDAAALRAMMRAGAVDIAEIVPEVRDVLPDLPLPPPLEPDQRRFRFFDSLAAFLRRSAAARPMALLIDDLHWADRPSLLLLEFLAWNIRDAAILVIGAYRDDEQAADERFADTLAALRRDPAHARLVLRGLGLDDTDRLLRAHLSAPMDGPHPLARALHERTEGNPFFIHETLRHLGEIGRLNPGRTGSEPDPAPPLPPGELPAGIREVLDRRLARLSARCRSALELAAVLGREFDLAILARALPDDAGAGAALDAVAAAETARIVQSVPATPGRFRFTHALVRDALYEPIGAARRIRLHRQAGEALEAATGGARVSEIAHHFFQASPAGEIGRALTYLRRAGEHARAMFAFEEAAGHLERALELAVVPPGLPDAEQGDLLLTLGEVRLEGGGDVRTVRDLALQAAAIARRTGAAEMLARAAWLFGRARVRFFTHDSELTDLLTEALTALGEGDSVWRVRLLIRLVHARVTAPDETNAALQAGETALAIARRLGDPETLAAALMAYHTALWEPENAARRLTIADEAADVASRPGVAAQEACQAHAWRHIALLELGDVVAADRALHEATRAVRRARLPAGAGQLEMALASRALLAGDFATGERHARGAFNIFERMGLRAYSGQPRLTLFFLHREQGRIAEDDGVITAMARALPGWLVVQCMAATLDLDLGRLDACRRGYEQLAAGGFHDLARGFGQGQQVAIPLLVDICHALGDGQRAPVLYDLLLPRAGRLALYSDIAALGAVDRYLGLLAAMIGRTVETARYFEAAMRLNEQARALPALAHTRYDYAAFLVANRDGGDRARHLLDEAEGTARLLGMAPLLTAIGRLRAAALRDAPTTVHRGMLPDGLTAREAEVLRLLAAGRTNKQIAGELVLSARTVERHIGHIYTKAGLTSRAEAALYAVRHDLLVS